MNTQAFALNEKNYLMKCLAGSRLYGTQRPESDYDWRAVCWTPTQVLLGLTNFEQFERHGDQDLTVWTLKRFFELAKDNNPNILDILCAPPETWIISYTSWVQIWLSRRLFLSANIRYRFSGYAVSQLKRLEGHHRWLVDPPSHEPQLEEFHGRLVSDPSGGQRKEYESPEWENRYISARKSWAQYQTWLEERNPARAALEASYGYDTKHGAHLVRLMLQAESVLATGDYNPVLSGAMLEAVLSVLHGGWKYEDLIVWAETTDQKVREMPTVLPDRPNETAIEKALMRLHGSYVEGQGWDE
jgi:uncharacterized protein